MEQRSAHKQAVSVQEKKHSELEKVADAVSAQRIASLKEKLKNTDRDTDADNVAQNVNDSDDDEDNSPDQPVKNVSESEDSDSDY